MDRYAVLGNPVNHSKSPVIHSAFAKQCKQAITYTAIHVEPGNFAQTVASFFEQGGKGLNVTVPFKQEAWALAEDLSADAQLAGAVNTLWMNNHGAKLEQKKILVLGAGGAARGIILPLLRERPAELYIVNRTLSKAEELAVLFAEYGNVQACGLDDINKRKDKHTDWLINATSASLQGELPMLPDGILNPGASCYDLMYAKQETVFCQWAKQAGAEKIMDGLGMLVEQAAEAFYLWRGVRPNTAAVIKSLR